MFITKDDLLGSINENILDSITQFDDTKLAGAVNFAVGIMSSHLNARYDVINIFNKIGDARDPVIMTYCVDIVIYRLHNLISPRKIPKLRSNNYDEAMLWLQEVKNETINPVGLPVITTDNTRDYIQFGGNPKRENHISGGTGITDH